VSGLAAEVPRPSVEKTERAQASLPALAVALLLLTAVTGIGLALADGAFADVDRDVTERRGAVSLSERLVAPDSPLTNRANVFNGSALDALTKRTFESAFPIAESYDVELSLNGEELVTTGPVTDGHTVRRIVLIERRNPHTFRPRFAPSNSVTVPRRTGRVDLHFTPYGEVTIREVRANGRVVLRNASGLKGKYSVTVSPFETTRLVFVSTGNLNLVHVEITIHPHNTKKAYLEVSVDA
jgi:hypothetical protein